MNSTHWIVLMAALCCDVMGQFDDDIGLTEVLGGFINLFIHPDIEQIHVSIGVTEDEMIVTWITQRDMPTPQVIYGISSNKLIQVSNATTRVFNAGKFRSRVHWVHRAVIPSLSPDTVYFYKCIHGSNSSELRSMKRIPRAGDPVRLMAFGDLGWRNGHCYKMIQQMILDSTYDVILYLGDFAYNLSTLDGQIGDNFMRWIEGTISRVPFQVIPGNHEKSGNFSHYNNIFSMMDERTRDLNNFFYSFGVGVIKVIAITGEFYAYPQFGTIQIDNQLRWLIEELEVANTVDSRSLRPWVIVMNHRPFYCSNTVSHCDVNGFGGKMRSKLEDLFVKYNVDVILTGHEHDYERTFPVVNMKVMNGSDPSDPYVNPKGPIHIVTGSAGNWEGLRNFVKNAPHYSAIRIKEYSFSSMEVTRSKISFRQIDYKGKVIDTFNITKTIV